MENWLDENTALSGLRASLLSQHTDPRSNKIRETKPPPSAAPTGPPSLSPTKRARPVSYEREFPFTSKAGHIALRVSEIRITASLQREKDWISVTRACGVHPGNVTGRTLGRDQVSCCHVTNLPVCEEHVFQRWCREAAVTQLHQINGTYYIRGFRMQNMTLWTVWKM
jgi:hypothetical protein